MLIYLLYHLSFEISYFIHINRKKLFIIKYYV